MRLACRLVMFQHTATRRWLLRRSKIKLEFVLVSTHSHPKVAASLPILNVLYPHSFNTQPPEGGCLLFCVGIYLMTCFNTQPPEGGCLFGLSITPLQIVSTHSHPKVAAFCLRWSFFSATVSTHSHPKVAASKFRLTIFALLSFNTQPPEGGCSLHKKARQISKLNTVFR